MYSTNWVILAIKIFSFVILLQINQVSSADYSALLTRLYQRASATNRPLIVLIDSNLLHSEHQTHNKPEPLLDVIGYDRLKNRAKPLSLLQKKKKLPAKLWYKPYKSYDIEKQLHQAFVPKSEKEVLRSPVIKNLLRISNDLRCQARNECADLCKSLMTGKKKVKCVMTCQVESACEPEIEESDSESCGEDECSIEDGSTRGYASTEPPIACPQC